MKEKDAIYLGVVLFVPLIAIFFLIILLFRAVLPPHVYELLTRSSLLPLLSFLLTVTTGFWIMRVILQTLQYQKQTIRMMYSFTWTKLSIAVIIAVLLPVQAGIINQDRLVNVGAVVPIAFAFQQDWHAQLGYFGLLPTLLLALGYLITTTFYSYLVIHLGATLIKSKQPEPVILAVLSVILMVILHYSLSGFVIF